MLFNLKKLFNIYFACPKLIKCWFLKCLVICKKNWKKFGWVLI